MAPRNNSTNSISLQQTMMPPKFAHAEMAAAFAEVVMGEEISRENSDDYSHLLEEGELNTPAYRGFLIDCLGNKFSPIHDVPLHDERSALFNFVCTAPRGSASSSLEACLDEDYNPFLAPKQDMELDSYDSEGHYWNHGLLPKTWGDWRNLETNHGGIPPTRKYPVEVIDISTRQASLGSIYPVKPLAAFSLVVKDENEAELCWKIVAIDCQDPMAEQLHDLNDLDTLLPGTLDDLKQWMTICQYRGLGGVSELSSLLRRKPAGARETLSIIMQSHASWKGYTAEQGIHPRVPCFRLVTEDPQETIKSTDSSHRKSFETIYEKAWVASSPDSNESGDLKKLAEKKSKSRVHNRSISLGNFFTGSKKSEDPTFPRVPSASAADGSKKWFKKTISKVVGGTRASAKSGNLRNLFKPSVSAEEEGERSPTESGATAAGSSKLGWLKKERVTVQFSEAPKLVRQHTTGYHARKLTRTDTMPNPNSHCRVSEEFGYSLTRTRTSIHRRSGTRNMEDISEDLGFFNPQSMDSLESPESPGTKQAFRMFSSVSTVSEAKVDLSSVDDEIRRMDMELSQASGSFSRAKTCTQAQRAEETLFRTKTCIPFNAPPAKQSRVRFGSFSGSLVSPAGSPGPKFLPVVVDAKGPELSDPPAMAAMPKRTGMKKGGWSPAVPRIYKAVQGSGFSPRSPQLPRPLPAAVHS